MCRARRYAYCVRAGDERAARLPVIFFVVGGLQNPPSIVWGGDRRHASAAGLAIDRAFTDGACGVHDMRAPADGQLLRMRAHGARRGRPVLRGSSGSLVEQSSEVRSKVFTTAGVAPAPQATSRM